jgi:uncharacterized protein YgiM (DUF1202 family)
MNFGKTAIALMFAICLCIGPAPVCARETGTILVSDLRMRSGPGKDYRVIAGLEKGTHVMILGRDNGWLHVEQKRRQGYVIDRDDFVAIANRSRTGAVTAQKKLKNSASDAETVHSRLRQARSDLASISRREKSVLDEFNTAEETLNRARLQVRAARAEMAGLEARIDEIEERSRELEKALDTGEAYAAKRLSALYKLNWLGRIHLLATAESFLYIIKTS